ncbi:LOW QUALITY PROTEIN: mitotic checkpoint serine/threonine-protein kinase BUB1 [Puntigrus tetrazona]|uniref:LOW QUALITY PROTEIN: mitotic checkpoint serine/threonine-protein kinase BUB1 n=1 Tax=Puntigrus tetrazona TaxID=1606681 RepID=UPI001C8A65FD|nr:LOW QUALITY PROTEIN: mitotic checkpoint serine/threonine-protein kinase BUB1 [Puntigrus tetrazona]
MKDNDWLSGKFENNPLLQICSCRSGEETMDVNSYFQAFEASVRSYAGDDPLDPWDKFVQFLDSKLSEEEGEGMCVVLERLVHSFLQEERYHNDPRYVAHCVRCAGLCSDPVEVYRLLHGRGVGTQAAALYLDWARQLEKRGQLSQAEAVYHRALENKAQPQDGVLQQYMLLQARVSASAPTAASDHVRQPLQNSLLVNQNPRQRDAAQDQRKDPEVSSPAPKMVRIISRSENNPVRTAGGNGVECVSMYCVNELQCEGSELSFEELRARRYFAKRSQQEKQRQLAEKQHRLWEEEEEVRKMKQLLEDLEKNVTVSPAEQRRPATTSLTVEAPAAVVLQASDGAPAGHAGTRDSSAAGGSLLGQTDRASVRQSDASDTEACAHTDVDVTADPSCSGFNHSHVTPNTSLGFAHTTPSRALPSPTVNTREALGVIMDMFQAPTLLQESMFNSTVLPEDSFEKSCRISSAPSCVQAPSSTPFMIYQDKDEQETGGSGQDRSDPPQSRALTQIPVSRANDTPVSTESMTDESTMWGARNISVGPCPNHTRDFALSAHLVSTPLHPHAPHTWDTEQAREEAAGVRSISGSEENPYMRQPTKLSPIMEQSPAEEKPSELVECSMRAQGTIVGEGVSLAQPSLGLSLAQHSQSSCSRLPLAALSFPDTALRSSSRPSWSIYQSPEKDLLLPQSSFHRSQSSEQDQDVPMSPEARWLQTGSSALAAEAEPEVMKSPPALCGGPRPAWTIYQSPEPPPEPELLWATSPEPVPQQDLDDLDLAADLLLPKKPFQRRKSGLKALQELHESLLMSPKQASEAAQEEPASPVPAPALDWFGSSPQRPSEEDLDVMASPAQAPRSPMDTSRELGAAQDDLVSAGRVPLLSDPWDEGLLVSLLSSLQPPLSSHPNLTVWSGRLPTITPKMTVQIAGETLRVDCVLGQGAFATVYQATSLSSSHKLFLKVQKPANPWEFYMDSQLNVRLQPAVRHLFNTIYSGHLFSNGSVLVGELHSCGTLLNAINLYKSRSEKVMPQPLVLYFSVCILHMVELLHRAEIIHADIKPDNFLLGERFLENDCFQQDHLEHGLALIDLGQSIDMTLFPEGTAFTAKCMTSGFQCVEMLSGRPWTYQTDYFGIAGTVHCMLFGTYMQVKEEGGVWRTNGVFKRNVHADLWQDFFHTLLNAPDCSSRPCLRALRLRLDGVLQQNYSSKLRSLKNRLVVQILEARSSRR